MKRPEEFLYTTSPLVGYFQYRGQNSSSSPRKRYRFFSRRFGVGRAVQTLQFVRPIKRIRSGGTTIVAVPRQKGPSECDGIISLFFMLLPARRSVIFPKNKEFDPRFTSHSQSKSLSREPDEGGTVRCMGNTRCGKRTTNCGPAGGRGCLCLSGPSRPLARRWDGVEQALPSGSRVTHSLTQVGSI